MGALGTKLHDLYVLHLHTVVSFPDCNVIHSLVPRPGNETMHYSLCPKVPAVLIGYIEKVKMS